MHKHNRKQVGQPKCRYNANTKLSESDSVSIRDLLSSLCIRDEGVDLSKDGQEQFELQYLKSEYLSKFCSESLTPASVRRENAIRKWYDTEATNRRTNVRLRGMDRGYNILPRVTFYSFLRFAQRVIRDILGPLDDSVVLGSFSGGASTSRRRTESHPARKFDGKADVTEEAEKFIDIIYREASLLRQYQTFSSLREVKGAVLFTVPKKTDIDRCACKEPDINMFLQKGVGKHIRRRLLRAGINLNDQRINRDLARVGSRDKTLATLDLSSASDSVTVSCVQALLPTEWFLYLNDIRSQMVEVDGTLVKTEMFSSMGNGFTFELESLIFYALMRTVSYFEGSRGVISVYGDDIIIPVGIYDLACHVLREFGFSINASKSFATGPFRESCGGHYYDGRDVTPFYLKRPATSLTDVIRVANQLRLWASLDPGREFLYPMLFPIWESLKERVPQSLWGGRDYAVDTQLVTPHAPNRRLCRVRQREELPDQGSYLHWHNSNWNRTENPDNGISPIRTDSFCRTRRAIPGAPTLNYQFSKELAG